MAMETAKYKTYVSYKVTGGWKLIEQVNFNATCR
jgi:hypothetical protein